MNYQNFNNLKIARRSYHTLIFYNNFTTIYLKTKLNDSARGYRWNDVILDAPIEKEILDCVIRPKIIRKEQFTDNFKIIK